MVKGTLPPIPFSRWKLRVKAAFPMVRACLKSHCPCGFLCVALVISLHPGLSIAFAQEETLTDIPQGNKEGPVVTFVAHVDEVDLPFIVTDRHHRWITDLSESEVRLRDNGHPPDSIRMFQSQTGLPLRLGLVLDTSSSIAEQFSFERTAAALFISQVVDSTKDLAFILGFNSQPDLTRDLTNDTGALAAAVQQLNLGGGTAIYDALSFACKKLQRAENGLTRRVLVLLTDGDDNSSHLQPEQLIQELSRCNLILIVLHTQPEPDKSDPKYRVLETLTKETGGQILPAAGKKDMAKAFSQLRSQLRNYYLLAYHPAQFQRDGSYRKIQLKTTRRGAHVICRHGYYAAAE